MHAQLESVSQKSQKVVRALQHSDPSFRRRRGGWAGGCAAGRPAGRAQHSRSCDNSRPALHMNMHSTKKAMWCPSPPGGARSKELKCSRCFGVGSATRLPLASCFALVLVLVACVRVLCAGVGVRCVCTKI
jgi:hypothetical protein